MKTILRIGGILATVAVLLVTSWIGYHYFEHYRSANSVDEFVNEYVESLVTGTRFYREHTKPGQVKFADEMRRRYALPYKINNKATSDGPYFIYDTAFQYVLKFENGKYLYLHIYGEGNKFTVLGIVDWTDLVKE